MVKVSRGKTATSCPGHSLIQFNCDTLVGDNQRRVNIHFFILLYGWSRTVEERLQKIVLISEENTRFLPEPLFHQFFQHSLIQDQNVKIDDNPHLMLLQYVFPNHCENIVPNSTNKSTLKKCSRKKLCFWRRPPIRLSRCTDNPPWVIISSSS